MSLLSGLFGSGKISTIRSFQSRRPEDDIDWPAVRRDFDSPSHPVLRRAIAEVRANAGDDRRHFDYFAMLSTLTVADAPVLAAEATLRLPVLRSDRTAADQEMDKMLRSVIGAAERVVRLWTQHRIAPPPVFTVQHVNDLAWALGGLLDHKVLLGDGLNTFMLLMMGVDLSGTINDARVRHALNELLQRIDDSETDQQSRVICAGGLVLRLGVARSSSRTLAAWDADVAMRTARREAIMAAAGPLLAPVVAILLDTPQQLRGGPSVTPAMRQLLAGDPLALGEALVALDRIERDFRDPPYGHWNWLTMTNGQFDFEPKPDNYTDDFDRVRAAILRRKIIIGDAAMAALIDNVCQYQTFPVAWRKPESNSYRSRSFLNLAVAVAGTPDGSATRTALRALLTPESAAAFPLPTEWRDAIVAVTGHDLAGVGSLPLPAVDPTDHLASERLLTHFANLGDRRLHNDAHGALLVDLVRTADAMPEQVEPKRLILPHGTRDERWLAWYYAHRIWERAQVLKTAAQSIEKERAAILVMSDTEATVLRRFGELCAQLEGKAAPTAKWRAEARRLTEALPADLPMRQLQSLLANPIPDQPVRLAGQAFVRGLILVAVDWPAKLVGPLLADYALGKCYQTVPNYGIRAEKLGNACLWTLINLSDGGGVPYLARMLARVKYPKIRKKIDAALNEAAAAAGLSRGALDELSVPTHGLDADGRIAVAVGDGQAAIGIAGNRKVDIRWLTVEGKTVKSPSVGMKADKPGLDNAKALAKEIEADLAVQSVRLQRIYLEARDWPVAEWRERYLEHPLMRGITQRLLWWLDGSNGRIAVLPRGDDLTDWSGNRVDDGGGRIRLWHPIDDDPSQVLRWRDRIEALAIVQPFAQAWREIYRLTDAEITTDTYTNRWAGHILKQHQFMTLARLNGWTVTHRMWVDAPNDAPAHLVVTAHGLVADYWVEGAGGDEPDVLDSLAYVYVSSDRLVFQRAVGDMADSAHGPARAGAIQMADVPPIVLTEVMRQCDLFTAVASIAADPMWRDRGRDAAHPNDWRNFALQYWEQQSFGEMSEAAKIRRAILERIVPKLAIADRCSFDEQALCVQGVRRRYRIHIGSAAIQVLPEKRHLCIVPAGTPEPNYYVPFEGDRLLSLIISKAVLLAADDRITDPVILAQL